MDVSNDRLVDFFEKFYGSGMPHEPSDYLRITTTLLPENPNRVLLDVMMARADVDNTAQNVHCAAIDIFAQVMDGHLQGPIYRIASYSFSNQTLPSIGLSYRRDYTYSRVVAVATLINPHSRSERTWIYNRTGTLKGGFSCGGVVVPG